MTAARTAALIALCTLAACGKKGPPLAPLNLVPARVADLTARRLGDEVQLQFTVPTTNQAGSGAADLVSVDVFAYTGPPVDARGDRLPDADFVAAASLVTSVPIAPPTDPDESEADAATRSPDPRPRQGDTVAVREALTAATRVPTTPPRRRAPAPVAAATAPEAVAPLAWVGAEFPLERHYAVAGRSRRGRLGPLSARVAVPLSALPPSPPAPVVRYDESRTIVEWADAAVARGPVQADPRPGELPAKPIVAGPPPHTYNVYAARAAVADAGAAKGALPATPLNATPLAAPRFEIAEVKFGQEQCFEVRTVQAHGPAVVESAPSPAACVTPRDTFAPAAPRNLAAVGAEGAINLIWEASGAADLAGYLVLRAEGGGAWQAITPAPIRETTFRDTGVRAGVRYVYAVVAVDTAVPPNRSPESNRVEETAR